MKAKLFDNIIDHLRQDLSRARFLHSVGTVHTCIQLAHRWGLDMDKAMIAGLLHDICKTHEYKELEKDHHYRHFEAKTGIILEHQDRHIPAIWHAFEGAEVAENKYGIEDVEILHAIKYHPTGIKEPSMTLKVLMISDYIEPHRHFEGVDKFRKLAFQDMDAALIQILHEKTAHVKSKGKEVHQRSIDMIETLTGKEVKIPC